MLLRADQADTLVGDADTDLDGAFTSIIASMSSRQLVQIRRQGRHFSRRPAWSGSGHRRRCRRFRNRRPHRRGASGCGATVPGRRLCARRRLGRSGARRFRRGARLCRILPGGRDVRTPACRFHTGIHRRRNRVRRDATEPRPAEDARSKAPQSRGRRRHADAGPRLAIWAGRCLARRVQRQLRQPDRAHVGDDVGGDRRRRRSLAEGRRQPCQIHDAGRPVRQPRRRRRELPAARPRHGLRHRQRSPGIRHAGRRLEDARQRQQPDELRRHRCALLRCGRRHPDCSLRTARPGYLRRRHGRVDAHRRERRTGDRHHSPDRRDGSADDVDRFAARAHPIRRR